MATKNKNIILFISAVRPRMVEDVRSYAKKNDKDYRIMVLRDTRLEKIKDPIPCDIYVECDFTKPHKIAEALLPYQDELMAVTCRFEQSIARFAQVIPHVPYLRTPTSESLAWASDKYEMRKKLRLYDKKTAVNFTRIQNNTKKERERVIEKVGFPMIVKPTNMVASLFVTICYHEEDLDKALRTLFRRIKTAYSSDGRLEEPKVIAEEYMDGDLYSVDTYVDARGTTYHCPLVRQRTAKEMGRDDFYNYLQITPTALKATTVERAQEATNNAIHALGLRSCTVHTELMKVDDEWKIIEVGPRPGGLRDTLHGLSCDIDHTMNDIAVRIPRKPIVPKKCKGYAAYFKFFAAKEGVINETKGIKKIEDLESFKSIVVNKKVGDRAVFAKNGGRSVFNTVLYNKDRSKLLADIRRIQQMVSVKVAPRTSGVNKKAVKKTGKKK